MDVKTRFTLRRRYGSVLIFKLYTTFQRYGRTVMRKLHLCAVALVAVMATGAVCAQSAKTGGDAMFVKEASAAGAAEVALGKLGQSQGHSDQVKQFATQMVKDHTAANEELTSLASEKGLTVATDPSAADAATAKRMGALQGAAFDAAFSKKMLADHKKAVALFQREAANGKDADLKAFAAKTLPTLKQHLSMAQALPAATGNSSVPSDTDRSPAGTP